MIQEQEKCFMSRIHASGIGDMLPEQKTSFRSREQGTCFRSRRHASGAGDPGP